MTDDVGPIVVVSVSWPCQLIKTFPVAICTLQALSNYTDHNSRNSNSNISMLTVRVSTRETMLTVTQETMLTVTRETMLTVTRETMLDKT